MELILHIVYFVMINLGVVFVGYPLIKRAMICQSWLLLVVSIFAVYLIFLHNYPIARMLSLIALTFTAMKVIAVAESYKGKKLTLTFKQWFVFATGWAGMRAEPFETLGAKALPNAWAMIRFGVSRAAMGVGLILLAHLIVSFHFNQDVTYAVVSVMLLVGLSLILHFGLLSVGAGSWRLSGVNAYFLFKQPAHALSLTEFWSKRWNLAFTEMTSIAIFRPLRKKTGPAIALMLAFIFSGLLHELALSAPVNHGYGLPLLYFIIQGLLVLVEKALASRNILFLNNKIVAHTWVFFWLVVPAPLLFHTQFIQQIVWPLSGL
jgi:alginate O-acetyltransferase complex protein AlgI